MKISIMQPHFFPWFGYFELIKFADIFVFLDDVQFPTRSYVNRVKFSHDNPEWITFPISRERNTIIKDAVLFEKKENFQIIKSKILRNIDNKNLFFIEKIFNDFLITNVQNISEFNIFFIKKISNFIFNKKFFYLSSELKITSKSSRRIFDICKEFNATEYITGHGSKNYLDHNFFQENNIEVKYINYKIRKYREHGHFKNNLSILDLISHAGRQSTEFMISELIDWKSFIAKEN